MRLKDVLDSIATASLKKVRKKHPQQYAEYKHKLKAYEIADVSYGVNQDGITVHIGDSVRVNAFTDLMKETFIRRIDIYQGRERICAARCVTKQYLDGPIEMQPSTKWHIRTTMSPKDLAARLAPLYSS